MTYRIADQIEQTARGVTHRYRLASTFESVNRRGHQATVLVWIGSCATCGQPFEATSSRAARSLNRNCELHRRPAARRPDHASPRVHDASPAQPTEELTQ